MWSKNLPVDDKMTDRCVVLTPFSTQKKKKKCLISGLQWSKPINLTRKLPEQSACSLIWHHSESGRIRQNQYRRRNLNCMRLIWESLLQLRQREFVFGLLAMTSRALNRWWRNHGTLRVLYLLFLCLLVSFGVALASFFSSLIAKLGKIFHY